MKEDMITSFGKRTVRVSNKYHCACGHKFYRELSDWFTNNQFNKKTETQCREEIKNRLSATNKACPKCQCLVAPN